MPDRHPQLGLTRDQITLAIHIARSVAARVAERKREHVEVTGEPWPPHPRLVALYLRAEPYMRGHRGSVKGLARRLLAGVQ